MYAYAELTGREVEYVAVSRDTTESDLKQRRELQAGGSSSFKDAAPVTAALEGRLLVLDGIEKAERNVLPTLNNLLENREMALDDGRFLMRDSAYDALFSQEAQATSTSNNDPASSNSLESRLCRVHPDFRVVALGLPTPPYPGFSLDPPLRSRFQARVVGAPCASSCLDALQHAAPQLDPSVARALCLTGEASRLLEASLQKSGDPIQGAALFPTFPHWALPNLARFLEARPDLSASEALMRNWPALLPGLQGPHDSVHVESARKLVQTHLSPVSSSTSSKKTKDKDATTVAAQGAKTSINPPGFVSSPALEQTLDAMLADLEQGCDVCVVGGRGAGKSILAHTLAVRYQDRQKTTSFSANADSATSAGGGGGGVRTLPLYKDLSARDLLQRRATDPHTGATTWEDSPLVAAAKQGQVLILDGVDRLPPDVLASLQRLTQDRYLDLCDGSRLVPPPANDSATDGAFSSPFSQTDSIAATQAGEQQNGDCGASSVGYVHPSFRLIALGAPPPSGKGSWLSAETATLFRTHVLPPADPDHVKSLLVKQAPNCPTEVLDQLLEFQKALGGRSGNSKGGSGGDTSSQLALSVRQLGRIVRRLGQFPSTAASDLPGLINRALLVDFLPQQQRLAVQAAQTSAGITQQGQPEETSDVSAALSTVSPEIDMSTKGSDNNSSGVNNGTLKIGHVSAARRHASRPELVPNPLFYDNPAHTQVMADVLASHAAGEKAILLIGNQGVGKNKVADRLLHLLNAEREYVQLHRDTTLGALTLLPSLEDGRITWHDSPLVRALTLGRVVVVDEADKAPLEVVVLLKALLEDGEILLADGRRVLSAARIAQEGGSIGSDVIPVHPDFSMWVLANRPGFPFLGNNFFGAAGDAFAVHVLDNPDANSEKALLARYAPTIASSAPEGLLLLDRLAGAFSDLRDLHSPAASSGGGKGGGGSLAYPYSMREAVAVAKHLEMFPADGIVAALENVLAFDTYAPGTRAQVARVFQARGVPLPEDPSDGYDTLKPTVNLAEPTPLPSPVLAETWKSTGGETGNSESGKN